MARSARPKSLPRFKASAGTRHELETASHATPSLAKAWLETRMKARKQWAERYCHEVRDQMERNLYALNAVNLPDAKSGREWEWVAFDPVSNVEFLFRLEVL